MKIDIEYGNKIQSLEISSKNAAVISLSNNKNAAAELDIISNAANNPIDSQDLQHFLQNCRDLLIIVNDGARATPSAVVLQYLSNFWEEINVKFIVATGSHRNPNEKELRNIFGKLYESVKNRIHIHNAVNDPMLELGITSRGTPVAFNQIIAEHDRIININSIEPHYFAGFTGGRKSLMPGIASHLTIEKNHALVMQPDSQILKLQGNPVHDDMMEAVEMIDNDIFSFNLVLDSENEIFAAIAGNWKSSFYKAVEYCRQMFVKSVPFMADIVVAAVKAPLNKDLYQAHKGVENCRKILKSDSIIILVAPCSGGIGKDEFYQLLSSCKDPKDVFSRIKDNYILGYHKAAKMADLFRENQLWMVTEIDGHILEKINIRKFDSLQSAVDEALNIQGINSSILINSDAGIIVPTV